MELLSEVQALPVQRLSPLSSGGSVGVCVTGRSSSFPVKPLSWGAARGQSLSIALVADDALRFLINPRCAPKLSN